jgi:hypothetical protein
MIFDAPSSLNKTVTLRFGDYIETYSASESTLKISMKLEFPANAAEGGPCVLSFEALYRQP